MQISEIIIRHRLSGKSAKLSKTNTVVPIDRVLCIGTQEAALLPVFHRPSPRLFVSIEPSDKIIDTFSHIQR